MYLRQQIDKLVLLKVLDDYKEILLNHGFMAIVLLQEDIKEVSLDDHKIIVVRDINFKNYENVLSNNHILYDSNLQFITDAEHVHISTDEYFLKFEKLVKRIDAEKIKCS